MMRWTTVLSIVLMAFAPKVHAQPANQSLESASPASVGLSAEPLAVMEKAIRSGEFKKIGSVLIARHGKLVYESYFDGDANMLRDTRSATKSITDILVGIAIGERKLSGVDARVLALLPGRARKMRNPDPRKDKITIEDFLTMSSPLECDDWNNASRGNEERMYLVEDWAQFILDLPVGGRMHVGEKVEPPPYGRDFSYCTGGVFTLSEVLAKATGTRTDRYAQEKLFGPLGITDVVWVYSPLNVPQTGGGLRLTSRDLLKIAELYRTRGTWEGKHIVDEDWVKASTTPHARIDDDTEYGYLWWLKDLPWRDRKVRVVYMSGNGGNKVGFVPELDLAFAITSNNYGARGMHEQTERVLVQSVLASVQP